MSAGETPMTVVGNLTDDPELRYTPSGAALLRFTVASTPRAYDKASGQWKDGTAMFMRCTAWRDLAENAAGSLAKGTRVVVTGRLRQHNWQNEQGENRSMLSLEVDDIGPSLRFATATVQRTKNTQRPAASSNDPWNTAAPSGGGSTSYDDKPPF
ncbi:single-stranded DNA-binding protein [Streptomyces mayteni]